MFHLLGWTYVWWPLTCTGGTPPKPEAQLKDPNRKSIIEAFEATRSYDFIRHTARGYIMPDGVLYRYSPETNLEEPRLVVPSQERENILREYHDAATAGHYGVERTLSRIAQRYFWLDMGRQVVNHVIMSRIASSVNDTREPTSNPRGSCRRP